MSGAVEGSPGSSPGVAEDWEDESNEASMRQLEERLKTVKLLQHERNDKEKARLAEALNPTSAPVIAADSGLAATKMKILRRPKSGDQLNEEDVTKEASKDADGSKASSTFEERRLAYEEARSRILGSDYKPETVTVPSPPPSTVARNRSPEQIRVPRPPEPIFVPNQMLPDELLHSTYANYGAPHMNSNPLYVPCFDASRPPPVHPSMFMPPGSFVPSQNAQYFTPPPLPPPFIPQQPGMVPYGHPPLHLYPPGSVAEAMTINTDAGMTQSQRKKSRKKNKTSASSENATTAN